MTTEKVVIAGATGLAGHAAVRNFVRQADCEVMALSRRARRDEAGATYLPLDLLDRQACANFANDHADTTHLVYAAVHEQGALTDGWRDGGPIETNDQMFRNFIDPFDRHGSRPRDTCPNSRISNGVMRIV